MAHVRILSAPPQPFVVAEFDLDEGGVTIEIDGRRYVVALMPVEGEPVEVRVLSEHIDEDGKQRDEIEISHPTGFPALSGF